jgi:hypothetical protein
LSSLNNSAYGACFKLLLTHPFPFHIETGAADGGVLGGARARAPAG